MKYLGKVDKINLIVVSDPMYGKNVKYRYENNQINVSNWLCELNLTDGDMIGIDLLLKKEDEKCTIEDGSINYLSDIKINKYKIAMDSACIALGINDKADEIINSHDEWQPNCALKTGMDGFFGEVQEGRRDNKLVFLLVYGYINGDLFYDTSDILDYLNEQFEIKGLVPEREIDKQLGNGTIVELNTCTINNDIGGTEKIRNKNYEDPMEGIKLTDVDADGNVISETVLHSNDGVVDKPIIAEITSGFYDYETGYKYKGKLLDNDLIEDFRKIGTTSYEPEDYKKYGNKSYEETKLAAKNYDSSIIYFSEFDILNVIDKNNIKDMEM